MCLLYNTLVKASQTNFTSTIINRYNIYTILKTNVRYFRIFTFFAYKFQIVSRSCSAIWISIRQIKIFIFNMSGNIRLICCIIWRNRHNTKNTEISSVYNLGTNDGFKDSIHKIAKWFRSMESCLVIIRKDSTSSLLI